MRILISSRQLKNKEIINISNGKSLGFVSDIEINLEKARIDALVLPAARSFLGIFSKDEEIEIKWKDVRLIGEDVILVNLPSEESLQKTEEADALTGS